MTKKQASAKGRLIQNVKLAEAELARWRRREARCLQQLEEAQAVLAVAKDRLQTFEAINQRDHK